MRASRTAIGADADAPLIAVAERPRKTQPTLVPLTHEGAQARYLSPLRYPGAKAGLSPVLHRLVRNATEVAGITVDLLVEPFAGGASTSLRLLADGTVRRALLADADAMVASFWQVAASEPERLIERMREEHRSFVLPGGEVALNRWDYWKRWQAPSGMRSAVSRFHQAVRCLFLNRTTFSGILHGNAGPIGGRAQESQYGIGCRFNPDDLAARIRFVGFLYDTGRIVDVWRADWRQTMQQVVSQHKALVPDNVIAYLDPPYVTKSDRLYATTFSGRPFPHARLAEYLCAEVQYRWLLSYDHHPDLLTPSYYGRGRMAPDTSSGVRAWPIAKRLVSLQYSASARIGRGPREELLVTTLPPRAVPTDKTFRRVTG